MLLYTKLCMQYLIVHLKTLKYLTKRTRALMTWSFSITLGSFITEFHSFPNETCGHSRALQAFSCLTGSSQAASIPLSTLLQLICQVAILRLTHLSRFAQGTIKPLKMKIISTEIEKSRLEENRRKAGSKENIHILYLIDIKQELEAIKRNNQENKNSEKLKIFQQK